MAVVDPSPTPVIAGNLEAATWTQYGRLARPYEAAVQAPDVGDRDNGEQLVADTLSIVSRATADWWLLVNQYQDWNTRTMMRILECESHGDENAVSPDGANIGGWQLNIAHGYSYEDATNPIVSTDLAHDVWLSQGYAAWACW